MQKIEKNNIYDNIPESLPKELIETLEKTNNVKIERIISRGHVTADNKWYNQDKNEFVLLLEGHAKILFEDNSIISMEKGDYIKIPKNTKHKVTETSKSPKALWLTIFY